MKKVINLFFVLISFLFVFSCNEKGGGDDAVCQLGIQIENAQNLYEVPEHQSVALNLFVAAAPVSEEGYTITMGANPALVSAYNTKNGTSCQMLPSDAFSFTSSSVILPKYSPKSSSCELRLKGEGCDPDITYLLPVVIDGVKGGSNFQAPDEKAAYIVVKVIASQQEGDGSQAHPFEVKDVESFLAINSMLKDDATVYFKLTADIDFAGVTFNAANPWKPMNYPANEEAQALCRARKIVLDGNNHKISNFKADGPLFAILCGSVTDLTLDGFKIDSDDPDAAPLVGVAGSSSSAEDFILKNVKVINSDVMTQGDRGGGLVSRMRNGLVENCSTDCPVEAKTRAGGLIGYVDAGTINNCSASGNIKVVTYYGGGLIGWAGAVTVKGCHASGSVSSETGNYTRCAGLIGQIEGDSTIEKCYATGNIEGQGHFGGGLIAVISSATIDKEAKIYENVNVTINECYATGNVTLPHGESGNWAHAGGLLGSVNASPQSTVTISNCYSTGAIAVRRYSGGFVGSTYESVRACKQLTITNSYTTSDITGVVLSNTCGLLIGPNDGSQATPPNTITCTGFVAWNTSDRAFSYQNLVPTAGNYYGTEGSVSQQAKALGWDESIWDLSGSLPKLKNLQ